MAEIVVQTQDGKEKSYPIAEVAILGRGYSVDIPIVDSKASRTHAKITKVCDTYFIQDMGSRNGTYVNDEQILERRRLNPDDVVRVGRTRMVFRDAAGAASTAEDDLSLRGREESTEHSMSNDRPDAPKQIGKFEILGRIGGGGMADVYKARHVENDVIVALKVIKDSVAAKPEFARRFHDKEAQIARRLEHPNLIEIYEDGVADGKDYLAMEYVEGDSLLERTVEKPATLDEALEILKQAARGLAEAHRHGVVHRDIKLSNILFRVTKETEPSRTTTRPLLSLARTTGETREEAPPPEAAVLAASLPEPRFVGREMELRRLENALGRAKMGSDSFILVRGERGWGKTRLLREFAARAQHAGGSVLWAPDADGKPRDAFERIVCGRE